MMVSKTGWLIVLGLLVLACSTDTGLGPNRSGLEQDQAAYAGFKVTVSADVNRPFPSTQIGFSVAEGTDLLMQVWNVTGYTVKTLIDGYIESGVHLIEWDMKNDDGEQVESAMYLLYFQATDLRSYAVYPICLDPDDCDDLFDEGHIP